MAIKQKVSGCRRLSNYLQDSDNATNVAKKNRPHCLDFPLNKIVSAGNLGGQHCHIWPLVTLRMTVNSPLERSMTLVKSAINREVIAIAAGLSFPRQIAARKNLSHQMQDCSAKQQNSRWEFDANGSQHRISPVPASGTVLWLLQPWSVTATTRTWQEILGKTGTIKE